MRRRLSNAVRAALVAALLALAGTTRSAGAQAGPAEDGALFLLLPVGARAVGMGQAVVAEQDGSEAVWWNPAGLARADKREAAIHHSQSVIGTGDAVSIVVPSSLLGVAALSVNILNDGAEDVTDPQLGGVIGSILPRSFVYAATYATPVGDHVNAGITYKVLQFRVDCSGACPPSSAFVATTSALDFGAQFPLGRLAPATLGVAVRNVGPRLQVNDNPQSDPLPTRLQIGGMYRVGIVERYAKDTELEVTGDLIDQVRLNDPSARIGADVTFQKKLHARFGYVFDGSEAGGPSIGLGLASGGLVVDIARLFQGLSAAAGQAPTYLSLRYLF